jgi:hypothetical protein
MKVFIGFIVFFVIYTCMARLGETGSYKSAFDLLVTCVGCLLAGHNIGAKKIS